MPASSKKQQKFMGMVHALQKGELSPSKVSDKIKKVAGKIDYSDAKDYASTDHDNLPDEVDETKVRQLIKKMVREMMKEGGPGSGPQGNGDDEDNPFDREPSDDELADIEKQFEGKLKEGFQKRHFLNLIKKEIDSLKGQIAYSKDKVNYKGTPDWEKKEFKGVLKDLLKKLKDSEKHYKRVQKLKEGKLTESQQVAKTILQQLGGNKFIAMTGAKNFGSSKNSLQFKIGRNSKSISHVIITLKSSDLYDVEFIRMRGTSRKVVKKLKGVYADMLRKIFTKYTGMRTSL